MEGAIGVFDSRYETVGEAVEEPERKSKYYIPKRRQSEQEAAMPLITPQESSSVETAIDLTQKVVEFMQQNNISDLQELLSAMTIKRND